MDVSVSAATDLISKTVAETAKKKTIFRLENLQVILATAVVVPDPTKKAQCILSTKRLHRNYYWR